MKIFKYRKVEIKSRFGSYWMKTYFGAPEAPENVSSLTSHSLWAVHSCLLSFFHFKAVGHSSSSSGNLGLLFRGLIFPVFCFWPQLLPPPRASDSLAVTAKAQGILWSFLSEVHAGLLSSRRGCLQLWRALEIANRQCQLTNEGSVQSLPYSALPATNCVPSPQKTKTKNHQRSWSSRTSGF